MIDIIFQYGDVVLAQYTYNDYTVYSMYYLGYAEPVILSEYKTLSEAIKEFYRYTIRVN